MNDACPHCTHEWYLHHPRCTQCGCQWEKPKPPPVPKTERELLIERIEDVLWGAFEAQDSVYADRAMDMIDASGMGVNMTAVAAAVVAAFDPKDDR